MRQISAAALVPALVSALAVSFLAAATARASDYLQTTITDGERRSYVEGVLEGYFLQDGGETLCADPYVIGKYVSCHSALQIGGRVYRAPATRVWVETNGQLAGKDVIDAQGRLRCTGPVSQNTFRGPDSYLSCP